MITQYRVYGRYIKKYFPFKSYPGTTLRGVFGLTLRRISCKTGLKECKDCTVYKDCPYASIYESSSFLKPSARIAAKSGKEGVTNPYTIEDISIQDERISYVINLFGDAIRWEHLVVMAIVGMGFEGLGFDPVSGERRRFIVERIDWFDPYTSNKGVLFTSETGFMHREEAGKPSNLLEVFDRRVREIAEMRVSRVLLYFKTPYLLFSEGKPSYTPNFSTIVMNLARKYSMLAEYHGVGHPFSLAKARALKRLSSKVRLRKWVIEGFRKVVKTNLNGGKKCMGKFAKGILTYELPEDFWKREESFDIFKLLFLGEYLHVGKLASAGYGDYELYFS
ncbi:MAG: hypothetical protein DRJ38_10440 [Thermoprotei archaeon]|nr:MAG: hypothetical protein DRJ38_10440 [Thermoprotei archaeon]